MTNSPPLRSSVHLDHIAHYVPDVAAAQTELSQLGFTLTPFSEQSHRLAPGAPLVPAGTGNQCVMLQRGYLEFLTPLADTPNAQQLRTAMARYTGVHLLAFGTDDALADHARLERERFSPLAPLALQRDVSTPMSTVDGKATVRFTVVRVAPEAMAEGRIQYCQHHTREWVWQPRWTTHANCASGLAGLIICVDKPEETAQRYQRFTGLAVQQAGTAWRLDTSQGYILFVKPGAMRATLGIHAPTLPYIAGYVVDSCDMNTTRAHVQGTAHDERVLVSLSSALGGFMLFQAEGSAPLAMHE